MALISSVLSPHGVVCNYNRIAECKLNLEIECIEYLIAIYVSKEARDAGNSPLYFVPVRIPFNQLVNDPRELFYPLLQNAQTSYLKNSTSDLPPGTEIGNTLEVLPNPPEINLNNTIV